MLAQQGKRKLVEVFSTVDPEFRLKVDEGVYGLRHAAWTPDCTHLYTVSEFNMRLTFWNLHSLEAV